MSCSRSWPRIGYENVKAEINTICGGVSADQKYSFFHYNCAHGLGHGVMLVTHNELFEALTTCDTLTDGWERESCYGGVFMENIMAHGNPDHTTKYLKTDDLLYPCNAVEAVYKQQCFLMQTSHALMSNGYDFDGVFRLCDGVETDFRATCYQSLGRDASGNTVSDAERTRDICHEGARPRRSEQLHCRRGQGLHRLPQLEGCGPGVVRGPGADAAGFLSGNR